MNKFKISQVLVLIVLALLLVITPSLPSSLRNTYLYFIFNLLIIALGAEAGLLSAFEDRKQPPQSVNLKAAIMNSDVIISEKREASALSSLSEHHDEKKKPKVVEKYAAEKIIGVVKVEKVNKCPSMPSLFFIGGGEGDEEVIMDEELVEEDEIGGVNGQEELFAKAEAFIGNFYKQLKMQREESWIY